MVFAKVLLCRQDSFGCIHDLSFLVLYCIVLYYIVLYYTVLYYISNTYHNLLILRTAVQNYVNMKFPLKSNELPINSNGFHEYMTAFRKVMSQCGGLLYQKLLNTCSLLYLLLASFTQNLHPIWDFRGLASLRSTRLLCGSCTELCFMEG